MCSSQEIQPPVFESIRDAVFDISKLQYERRLGYDREGVWCIVTNTESGIKFAQKCYLHWNIDIKARMMRQVEILMQMDHPCVIRFFGFSMVERRSGRDPCILLSLMKCSLADIMERADLSSRELPADLSKAVVGCAYGMKYVHEQGILHGGVRPTAILIADNGLGWISDFARSQVLTDYLEPDAHIGRPEYIADEIFFRCGPYSLAADVFSFGVVLYQVVFLRYRYRLRPLGTMRDLLSKARSSGNIGDTFKMGVHCRVLELIDACWSDDSEKRPSFSDIINVFERIDFQIFDDMNAAIAVKSCIPTELRSG